MSSNRKNSSSNSRISDRNKNMTKTNSKIPVGLKSLNNKKSATARSRSSLGRRSSTNNEGKGETPLVYVTSTLRNELKKFATAATPEDKVKVEQSVGLGALLDENNNVILDKEEVSLPPPLPVEMEPSVTLGACPNFRVIYMDGDHLTEDQMFFIPRYEDALCLSDGIPSQKFAKKVRGQGELSCHFYQWSIEEDFAEDEEIEEIKVSDSDLQRELAAYEESLLLAASEISLPVPTVESTTDQDQPQPLTWWDETTGTGGPDEVQSQDLTSIRDQVAQSQLTFHQNLEHRGDDNALDFMSDFMRMIIPENLDSQIFSSAYEMGSELLNVGLQLATSFIGDESELEPREDTLKYNGYEIRTKGRGVLLQGVHLNCNLGQGLGGRMRGSRDQIETSTASQEALFSDPFTRIRILVGLSAPSSVPQLGEHGYHAVEIEQRVILGEGVWTFHYGASLVQLNLPIGVDAQAIRHRVIPQGVLIIQAP